MLVNIKCHFKWQQKKATYGNLVLSLPLSELLTLAGPLSLSLDRNDLITAQLTLLQPLALLLLAPPQSPLPLRFIFFLPDANLLCSTLLGHARLESLLPHL